MGYTKGPVDPHMAYVKCASELAARREQVKALRVIAKKLFDAAIDAEPPSYGQMRDAIEYYKENMK